VLKPIDPRSCAKCGLLASSCARADPERSFETTSRRFLPMSSTSEDSPGGAKAQAQLALHQLGEQRTDATTARALRLISQQIDR